MITTVNSSVGVTLAESAMIAAPRAEPGCIFVAQIDRTGGASSGFNDTTPTNAQLLAYKQCSIGSHLLRYMNRTGQIATLVAGSNVTLSGTMTIADNAWRDFLIMFPGGAVVTITDIGGGTL